VPIVQQNSGLSTGTGFTVTTPGASNASNRLVLFVAGNTTVTTLSGWTLRTSQVNQMGHYLYDKAGDGASSWTWANASGQLTWAIFEVGAGGYDIASSANNGTGTNTYNTPTLTPTAGTREVLASLASLSNTAARTISGWTNSFVELVDLCQATADNPMQGVASLDDIAANGSTGYSTTGTYSQPSTGRSAIIAAYSTSAGAAPLPPELIMPTRRAY
jgi:hypothetical protein